MFGVKSTPNALALKILPHLRGKQTVDQVDLHNIPEVNEVKLLATGGFNSIWTVKPHKPLDVSRSAQISDTLVDQFVLRLPFEDALLPNQITNDVAFKQFCAAKLPHIPVPKVYFYQATSQPDTSFIIEEYIDCPPLSSTWMSLAPAQKDSLAQKISTIVADLAEVHFDLIGGLNPLDWSIAPTVEGCKLFKGRGKFHRNDCYPIGPYKSTKDYILSCYDREIYYYTHATDNIDADLFSDVTVQEFVDNLQRKRTALMEKDIVDEPFVLVHGDLHGRNILARGDQIIAVLDWEFAGSYPLSETLTSGPIEVLEADSEDQYEENWAWGRKIQQLIQHEVVKRAWDQNHINLLMGDGNLELGEARMEMVP
ncbi:kinase-like domain-containing protein [Hypoxylon argillaceum]|nr:kinase-like domain-containing protein [Hypoxylon argillaceum]